MITSNQSPSWIKRVISSDLFSLLMVLVFFLFSYLSRSVYSLFSLVVVIGIGFPLIWDSLSKEWRSLGFFKRNLKNSLAWGMGVGIISSLVGVFVLKEITLPSNLGPQLLIGIPSWLLVISPFQEFFFRGWMQSRLSDFFGKWIGLILANVCFTAWHYLSPIIDLAPFPLTSYLGLGSTFFVGLLYGYSFQRSKNIIAPWVGHTISGIVFIIIGAMDLIQVIR